MIFNSDFPDAGTGLKDPLARVYYWQGSGVSKMSGENEKWTLIHTFSLKPLNLLCSSTVLEGKSWLLWQPGGPARLARQSSSMCFAGNPRVPAHPPPESSAGSPVPSTHLQQSLSSGLQCILALALLAVFCLHWSYNIKQWHGFINILWGILLDFEMS